MDNEKIIEKVAEPVKKPAKKPAKKATKGKAIWFGILCIMIYLGIQIFISILSIVPLAVEAMREAAGDMQLYMKLYLEKISNASELVTNMQAVSIAIGLVVFLLWYYIGVCRKEKKQGKYENVMPKLLNIKSIGFIICAAMTVLPATILLSNLARMLMPTVGDLLNTVMDASLGGNMVIGNIAAVILAPIVEELIMRGLVMNYAKKAFKMVGCVVLTTILFSVIHMNPIQGLYVIPMGVIWGYVAYKYNSVIPTIFMHIMQNLISVSLGSAAIFDKVWFVLLMLVVFAFLSILLGKKLEFINPQALKATLEAEKEA